MKWYALLILSLAPWTSWSAQDIPKCKKDLDGGITQCFQNKPDGCKWVDPKCDHRPVSAASLTMPAWKNPAEVSAWIGGHFNYDKKRAASLKPGITTIYEADELYRKKGGVCVDLAHFSYSAISNMDPAVASDPAYVMMKFEPCSLPKGGVMEKHWMTSFKGSDGKMYFMGDTRHIGRIFGPYENVDEFMKTCYADLKPDRKLNCYQVRSCFNKECTPRPQPETCLAPPSGVDESGAPPAH
jgi:hypothetical protein